IELDTFLNSRSQKAIDIEKAIQYLDKGVLFFGWMGFVTDVKTKQLIAPDGYYTDGVWIWPSYFPYYLKQFPAVYINEDFVEHLMIRNYKFVNDFDDLLDSFEAELGRIFKEERS
ncbi:MAG TPA: hypothetical protein VGE79_10795, partial [Niastella sp.]